MLCTHHITIWVKFLYATEREPSNGLYIRHCYTAVAAASSYQGKRQSRKLSTQLGLTSSASGLSPSFLSPGSETRISSPSLWRSGVVNQSINHFIVIRHDRTHTYTREIQWNVSELETIAMPRISTQDKYSIEKMARPLVVGCWSRPTKLTHVWPG